MWNRGTGSFHSSHTLNSEHSRTLQLIFWTLVEPDQFGSRETYRGGTEQQLNMLSAALITGRRSIDSGPPFWRSARVNPNRNPDPRNGGPPEWRTPGMGAGTVVFTRTRPL